MTFWRLTSGSGTFIRNSATSGFRGAGSRALCPASTRNDPVAVTVPPEAVDVLAHVHRDFEVGPDGWPVPYEGVNMWYGPAAMAINA